MTSSPRAVRSAGVAGLLLLAFAAGAPQSASAQLWLQTARVITPVGDGPTRAFLDTLVNVAKRKGGKVKRAPDRAAEMSLSALQDELISAAGIGVSSANHAFISYRVTVGSGRPFEQQITDIRFVFRPGPGQSDVSVMHVDADERWARPLHQKGTSLRSNQAALIPFHRHLGFANIARQGEDEGRRGWGADHPERVRRAKAGPHPERRAPDARRTRVGALRIRQDQKGARCVGWRRRALLCGGL